MMQSTSEGCTNIAELANQLRLEKIFINSERELLQNLNEEVERSALELLQAAWICSQQRQNLTNLTTSRSEADSIAACQRASLLESTTFIDVYKVLKYKEAMALGELLGWLRDSPHLVALCLLLGEEHLPPGLAASLVAGLYGSCRSAGDRTRLLAVMRSLIKHQLAHASDPRKLVRSNKAAFGALFAVYRDGHSAARQFLVAVLHAPVMAVLGEDEFFLDVDPDKAMERFSQADRLKKFGQPNTPEYNAKVARYRKWIVQCLYNLTIKFIHSLKENWANFPSTIAWIVQQMVQQLKQNSRSNERELHALCTELVLVQFLCPAIVSPETHGVVDVTVSYVARFNLCQIAQILQMLCLSKYQEVEPKLRDLYGSFERGCVWRVAEAVWAGGAAPAPAPEPAAAALRTAPHQSTTIALYTPRDAHALITYLKRISSKLNNNTPSVTADEQPAAAAADGTVSEASSSESSFGSGGAGAGGGVSAGPGVETSSAAARLAALLQTLEPNYRARLHDLLRKMPDFGRVRQSPTSESKEPPENGHKRGILAKVGKRPERPERPERPANGGGSADSDHLEPIEVLLIKLPNMEEQDYVGLVPESKVLECYYGGSEAGDPDDGGSALAVAGPGPTVQKRTRFSVSHDEVSLGNTSDNLEAVSEAASNHSVTSSLELETEDQNDNLSDMVSANVSGRGSPNISGRETPSSQVTDGDAPADGPPRRLPPHAPANPTPAQAKLLKQTRNEIEDKFCKFEIRKLLEGDETISIMSDTWSTDVLASDSETIGDSCEQTQVPTGQGAAGANGPDVSETASESAWSMDVLASDSDRNTEVDTDDCVSVAARSDTSWPRRPSAQEESTPVKLPNQNGNAKRPDFSSPRHTSRPSLPNRSGGALCSGPSGPGPAGYLSATAALSRGGELDLPLPHVQPQPYPADNRKSILVNGYPVMTCYAQSAPDSPSASAAVPLPNDVFDYPGQNGESAASESTLEPEPAPSHSDATSQWVDDSFPPQHSPERAFPSTSKYGLPAKPYEDQDMMDRSLNSSESSFNAMSVSQYDRRFDSGIEPDRPEPESRFNPTIADLMTRMSSATISTSANLVNNLTARIVKSEIRTSIISISSSRIEKRRDGTSNMSLSTLSVNSAETSVSDKSSSQDVNSENVTERRISPPPIKPSTGAIPKSISFDATAEKTQRRRITHEDGLAGNLDELKNNVKRSGGNLLSKIKMFRQKGRSHNHHNDIKLSEEESRSDDGARADSGGTESSEDILAKYRRKPSQGGGDPAKARRGSRRVSDVADAEIDRCEGMADLSDPEVFNSMKRRLRLVLANSDMHAVQYVPSRCTHTSLVWWVRACAACAPDEAHAAHAAEVARALAAGGPGAAGARLAAALRADLSARRPYAAYLASCRAGLAHTLHSLNAQLALVASETVSWAAAAGAARATDQLERCGALRRLARHQHHHDNRPQQNGELMDEKATRLTASIKAITAEVKADPSWECASARLLEAAELTVERAAFARLYLHVLFPNGDGDIARDQVLSSHIRRLSRCTGARRAGVAARHRWAAPFPRAQLILRHLAVYRTPRDKVSCVMRCVTSLMAVLGLADGAPPAADDVTPALIYVILKVNPPSLLSTIELVNALSGASLSGEQLYWWTQFCAAVAYIKTMDYPRDGGDDQPDT